MDLPLESNKDTLDCGTKIRRTFGTKFFSSYFIQTRTRSLDRGTTSSVERHTAEVCDAPQHKG